MSVGVVERIFEAMEEGLVLIEPDGRITHANPAAERILGLTKSEIEARDYVSPAWKILRPDGTPMPPEEMPGPRAMATQRPIRDVVMGVKRGDGSVSWIKVDAIPLFAASGGFEGIAGTFSDITRSVEAKEELQQYADGLEGLLEEQTQRLLAANQRLQESLRIDDLTGVRSRRGFFECAEFLIKIAARQGKPVTVAYIDVDDFKALNDTLGHREGDRLLAAVGSVLSNTFRSTDVVGRLGGDEFGVAVFAPITGSRALFDRLYDRLLETMHKHGWKSGVSIGVAAFSPAPPGLEVALNAADALMYRAKQEEGVRVVYDESANLDPASISD